MRASVKCHVQSPVIGLLFANTGLADGRAPKRSEEDHEERMA